MSRARFWKGRWYILLPLTHYNCRVNPCYRNAHFSYFSDFHLKDGQEHNKSFGTMEKKNQIQKADKEDQ